MEIPTQSQSITVDQETSKVVHLSEGKLTNSEQEVPDSGTGPIDA